jgi:hypothetical protein
MKHDSLKISTLLGMMMRSASTEIGPILTKTFRLPSLTLHERQEQVRSTRPQRLFRFQWAVAALSPNIPICDLPLSKVLTDNENRCHGVNNRQSIPTALADTVILKLDSAGMDTSFALRPRDITKRPLTKGILMVTSFMARAWRKGKLFLKTWVTPCCLVPEITTCIGRSSDFICHGEEQVEGWTLGFSIDERAYEMTADQGNSLCQLKYTACTARRAERVVEVFPEDFGKI